MNEEWVDEDVVPIENGGFFQQSSCHTKWRAHPPSIRAMGFQRSSGSNVWGQDLSLDENLLRLVRPLVPTGIHMGGRPVKQRVVDKAVSTFDDSKNMMCITMPKNVV